MKRPWTSQMLAVNNTQIHVTRTGGDRPPLIALHGRTGNGLTWTRLARRLASDFDVIMPDLRGHGRSASPSSGWNIPSMAQDILNLAQALDLPAFTLMGASLGAAIAAHVAANHPSIVSQLILGLSCWEAEHKLQDSYLARKLPRTRATFRQWRATDVHDLEAHLHDLNPTWDPEDIALVARAWHHVREGVAETHRHDLTENRWRELLRQVQCRTLLLMGKEERDWTDTLRFCKTTLPLSTPALVPGGHAAMYDHFDAYANRVLTFLKPEPIDSYTTD